MPGKILDILHFSFVFILLLISLLAVFRAPTNLLWKVSIVITEWGFIAAIIFIAMLFIPYKSSILFKFGTGFTIVSILLVLSPLVRATIVANKLPKDLNKAIGNIHLENQTGNYYRNSPLNYLNLFSGIKSSGVEERTFTFKENDGIKLDLDIYRPALQKTSLPCVLVIHGGAWYGGDSKELSPLNNYLAARGYVVVSINYRLAPNHKFPAPVEDTKHAIEFIKSKAKYLLIDPDNIVLLGRSAGGQIALSAAYTLNDPAIKGVISFYAPADMVWGYSIPGNPWIMDSRKVLRDYIGGSYEEVPDNFKRSSPLEFVSPTSPPTLIIHGIRDEMVAYEHSIRLNKKLEQNNIKHFLLTLPWATHGADFNFSGPTGQISTYTIERFLKFVTG